MHGLSLHHQRRANHVAFVDADGLGFWNLECTLRLAKGVAFHRLPTETLTLAALAGALLGVTPDKTPQKADWAIRPLSQEHITYAAEDTVYCSRVRTALEAIDKPPRPEEDDPESIDNAFSDAKLRELNANAELRTLRESVHNLMTRENMRRFSRFAIWNSERLEVPLRLFVRELALVDPARMLELRIRVTKEMVELFDGPHERLYAKCRATRSLLLYAPRLRRAHGERLFYDVTREDADRVTRDYESLARALRIASSFVDELKQRMRGVLELHCVTVFKAWSLAPGPVARTIDVRDALDLAPSWADRMVPLTKQFQVAIGEDAVESLAPAMNTTSSSVIRWCPKSDVVGMAAQQSRWWVDSTAEDE